MSQSEADVVCSSLRGNVSNYHHVREVLLHHGSDLPAMERLNQAINLGGGDGGEPSIILEDVDGEGGD